MTEKLLTGTLSLNTTNQLHTQVLEVLDARTFLLQASSGAQDPDYWKEKADGQMSANIPNPAPSNW